MRTGRFCAIRWGLHAGWLAGGVFALAAWGFAMADPGHVAARHPPGHLGALGAPLAWGWNLLGFVLPGVLLLACALALEGLLQREGAGRCMRLATGLLMLSALAFAAQGLLRFDLQAFDGAASQRHVSALALAVLGQLAAALLLALAVWRRRGWRLLAGVGLAIAALLLLFLILPAPQWLPPFQGRPGHAQRLLFGLYFAWFALAAAVGLRRLRSF